MTHWWQLNRCNLEIRPLAAVSSGYQQQARHASSPIHVKYTHIHAEWPLIAEGVPRDHAVRVFRHVYFLVCTITWPSNLAEYLNSSLYLKRYNSCICITRGVHISLSPWHGHDLNPCMMQHIPSWTTSCIHWPIPLSELEMVWNIKLKEYTGCWPLTALLG